MTGRVPDVSTLPCPKAPGGRAHQMLPVERRGHLRHHCAHCGKSWIALDEALRKTLPAPKSSAKPRDDIRPRLTR